MLLYLYRSKLVKKQFCLVKLGLNQKKHPTLAYIWKKTIFAPSSSFLTKNKTDKTTILFKQQITFLIYKTKKMSKSIKFLPWAMRLVIILCLIITHIQKDSLVYILSSLNLILIIFCIWGWSKSKTQNILKALTGNKIQNIFDILISTLFIIIGLYYKDTTTVIEGGALVTISVINILSPIKYKKS